MATHMAAFGRGKPRVDMLHHRAMLGRNMMQDVNEGAKPQVRDLAAPQGFHALEVEGLQADGVVLETEVVRQLPVKGLPETCHTAMDLP